MQDMMQELWLNVLGGGGSHGCGQGRGMAQPYEAQSNANVGCGGQGAFEPQRRITPTCYNCGKLGHIRTQCPKPIMMGGDMFLLPQHIPNRANDYVLDIMRDQGVCGGHFSHDITSRKILQEGFVWPSLHRDVRHWCQSCHRCQRAGDRRFTYEPQTPILAHGPFEKWRIDAIGPLPRATSGKLYIIMGVDYMTRWAEATTTSRITAIEVAKFIFEHICCRFGVPLEILLDRGPGFIGDLVGELMEKLKIKRRHSTPYYPQCNGLVEKVNGMICKIITKQVVSKPKEWDKHLEAALWSYRTSFRISLDYTPYHLVFGKEAILPIEVQLASLRVLASGRETPKEQLQ
ncbi:hypothetical protein L7F22_016753 [Adiantum nelumboides]|nr:hypothetical protein [Adiantum nelumboides]